MFVPSWSEQMSSSSSFPDYMHSMCIFIYLFLSFLSVSLSVRLSIRPTDAYVVTFQKYFSFSFVCFVLWGGKSVDSTNSMNVTNVMYHWCVVPTYIHTYVHMLLSDRVVWRRKNGSPRKNLDCLEFMSVFYCAIFLASGGSFMRTKEDDKFKMSIATKRRCQEFKYRLCILNDVIFCAPHDIEQGFTNFPGYGKQCYIFGIPGRKRKTNNFILAIE